MRVLTVIILVSFWLSPGTLSAADRSHRPDYSAEVAPILVKYCVACHNAEDREGQLSLESYSDLQHGGERGPAILPGLSQSSRLIRVLTGQTEPAMPPDDNEQPSVKEISLLAAWIDAGAEGPNGTNPARYAFRIPKVTPATDARSPITSLGWSFDGKLLAAARFGRVDVLSSLDEPAVQTFSEHPGKVNMARFTRDGVHLITASGITGLYGEARIWNVADGSMTRRLQGHRDILFAAIPSPDGMTVATSSYDRTIILWNVEPGQPIRTLKGHNGAVYDVAFSPDGSVLASASGDETVKLWHVETGRRLDTLSQPGEEQFAVAFSPDGKHIVAAGADNRIRVWLFLSRDRPRINPLAYSRFAHEGPIVQLVFSPDGRFLASSSENRMVKLWDTQTFTEILSYDLQPDVPAALAITPDSETLVVGRLDGSVQHYRLDKKGHAPPSTQATSSAASVEYNRETAERVVEQEPNDALETANVLSAPGSAEGRIDVAGGERATDADLYRFASGAGNQWLIQIKAAQDKSPLDSKLEILDANGQPVLRVLLQAVRDSYLNFSDISSSEAKSVRIHNWEEMELNDLLYMEGEIMKLFRAPQGPDSGFSVYSDGAMRYGFFDTTPTAHAMDVPCYIVRPLTPGVRGIPNGLPIFPIYYENDDDSRRRFGRDSSLTFTAPLEGIYFVRVTDVRGASGEEYKYQLTVRPIRPDFSVRLIDENPEIPAGSGKRFELAAERIDGFNEEIKVDISNLPPGISATTPLLIQAGHERAFGSLYAEKDALQSELENEARPEISATAMVGNEKVTKPVDSFGQIKLVERPNVFVHVTPKVLTVEPGHAVVATIRVERNEFDERVTFDARNLPHGVIVDNIGLNGILIPENKTERTIFIKAEKWVPETSRPFFLESKVGSNPTSRPVMLHIRNK